MSSKKGLVVWKTARMDSNRGENAGNRIFNLHMFPESSQFLGQPMYDPLSSAIKPGGNCLRQRSYLRDAHLSVSCCDHLMRAPVFRRCRRNLKGTFPHLRSSTTRPTSFTGGSRDGLVDDIRPDQVLTAGASKRSPCGEGSYTGTVKTCPAFDQAYSHQGRTSPLL